MTRSRVAATISPTDTATRSRAAATTSPTDTATRSRTATDTTTRTLSPGSTASATNSRAAGTSSNTLTETRTETQTPTETRTETHTATETQTPSNAITQSPTSATTPSPTPSSSMSTAITLNIPSSQQANADTLIRGYISNYAAQAGYSNADINSVTWANGVYTVTGNVVGAQQFQNGFPLSSAYTNLLASLVPSPSPTPSSAPSVALPIGIAVGATALAVIGAATAIYLTRQKRRRISFDPNAPTVMNTLKNAIPATRMSLPTAIQPVNNMNEDYYDPEQATRPISFQENSHVQTLQKQASLPAAEIKARMNFIPITNTKSSIDKIKMSTSAPASPQIPHGFQTSPSTRQLVHPFMARRHTLPPPPASEFDLNKSSPSLQQPPPPPPPPEEPRVVFNALPPRQNYPPPPLE